MSIRQITSFMLRMWLRFKFHRHLSWKNVTSYKASVLSRKTTIWTNLNHIPRTIIEVRSFRRQSLSNRKVIPPDNSPVFSMKNDRLNLRIKLVLEKNLIYIYIYMSPLVSTLTAMCAQLPVWGSFIVKIPDQNSQSLRPYWYTSVRITLISSFFVRCIFRLLDLSNLSL